MALAISNLTSSITATPSASNTTASISPTSGDVIILSVTMRSLSTGNYPDNLFPRVSGAGLNLRFITSAGSGSTIIYMFAALADAGATSGAITIAFGSAPSAQVGWVIEKVTGADASTPNSWLVQANSLSSTSLANPTITLNAPQDASSLFYGVLLTTAASTAVISPGSGWTQLVETSRIASNIINSQYKVNDASVAWADSTPAQMFAIGLEITASNSAPSKSPLAPHFLGCMGAGG